MEDDGQLPYDLEAGVARSKVAQVSKIIHF